MTTIEKVIRNDQGLIFIAGSALLFR